MDIRPILSTLRRHKTAAALIVLEVALSCAIICNAVFLISTRLQRMDRLTQHLHIITLQTDKGGRIRHAERLPGV